MVKSKKKKKKTNQSKVLLLWMCVFYFFHFSFYKGYMDGYWIPFYILYPKSKKLNLSQSAFRLSNILNVLKTISYLHFTCLLLLIDHQQKNFFIDLKEFSIVKLFHFQPIVYLKCHKNNSQINATIRFLFNFLLSYLKLTN